MRPGLVVLSEPLIDDDLGLLGGRYGTRSIQMWDYAMEIPLCRKVKDRVNNKGIRAEMEANKRAHHIIR